METRVKLAELVDLNHHGDGSGATATASHGGSIFGPIKDDSTGTGANASGTIVKKLVVDGGAIMGKPTTALVSKFFATLASGASDSTSLGAQSALAVLTTDTDYVLRVALPPSVAPAGVQWSATLTANNTVTINRTNNSGGSVSSATVNVRVVVERFT